jgi:transposase-like protein
MTLVHALSQIPSERQIRRQLVKIIFGPRVWCPDCGRQCHVQCMEKNKTWRCRVCRNKFSLTSMTWLKGMKLSMEHLWALIWCWQKKIPIQQACDLLNVSIPTVRRYYALFRDHLDLDFEVILEGSVQMDEMFVKRGCVIGGKDIKRKKIKLSVLSVPYPVKKDAMDFIQRHVKPGSILCTDGGAIYKGCEKWWPLTHVKDIHKRFEFEITSEIEGMWANLRTFIRRMYHHVTFRKFPKIVAEFEARYSEPQLFNSVLNYLKNALQPVTIAF